MEFILDTNAYRTIATKLFLEDIPEFIIKHRQANNKVGGSAIFSIIVALELVKHLKEGDCNFKDCYKALCIMVNHVQGFNKDTPIKYIPPLQFILTKYFFDENPSKLSELKNIYSLADRLSKPFDQSVCSLYLEDVNLASAYVLQEKDNFKKQVENLIRIHNDDDEDGDNVDWNFFRKNKSERDQLLNSIRSEDSYYKFALSMYGMALNMMNKPVDKIIWEEKKDDFVSRFSPAIGTTVSFLEKLAGGASSMQSIYSTKWNTLMDIYIMMGSLFQESPSSEERILVTLDKPVIAAFTKEGLGHKVITLWEYRALMDLSF